MSCVFLSKDTNIRPILVLTNTEEVVFTEIQDIPEIIVEENISTDIPEIDRIVVDSEDLNKDLGMETPEIKKGVPKPPKSPPRSGLGRGARTANKQISKIQQRLESYGAKSGEIQISLSWDNYNDIDLWVEYEGGYTDKIGWNNKVGLSGGVLDIDMNAVPSSNKPVENIYWTNAKPGLYTVYVYYYCQWDDISETTISVRSLVQGKESFKTIRLRPSNFSTVFSFRIPGPTYR